MEAQTNKEITPNPCNIAKRTLELEAKHDQVHTLFHLQIDAGPAEGLRWCRRGHTHLERHTGEPNEQSRHSGGTATLLPLSLTGWWIKPPIIRRRGAPREQTGCQSPSHHAHAAFTWTTSTNRGVEPRRHELHK
jgi:hypothetical protein